MVNGAYGPAWYGTASNLAGSGPREWLFIFDDEYDHYMEQAKEALSHIKSEEDLQRMKDAIQKISEQRVWMRAEMFRDAMTKDEIESFIEANRR